MEPVGCIRLWGRGQRYVLTELLFDHGPLRVAEIMALLHAQDLLVGGRPSKTVSDALRWEVAQGRVVRLGRGLYGPGRMPRSTRAWIRRRNRLLRAQQVCPMGRPVASEADRPHPDRPHPDRPHPDSPHPDHAQPDHAQPDNAAEATGFDAPAGASIRAGRADRHTGARGSARPDEVVVVGAGWCEAEEAAEDAARRRQLLAELGWSGPETDPNGSRPSRSLG